MSDVEADVKQVKRTPTQEQRDRLFAALRGVQHRYQQGYVLTKEQMATIDALLEEIGARLERTVE